MNATKIKASSLSRRILLFGVFFVLLLPALFSINAASSPQEFSINPVLDFSTYLGGDGTDSISSVAVDRAGNIYVTGSADNGFPTTPDAFQTAPSKGNSAPFVAKLDATSKAIVYSTFLGGFDSKTTDIAVDSEGNAYVTGETSAQDFPVTPGAFQTAKGSRIFAFITKLNASGSNLIYSTYFGGSGTGASLGECGASTNSGCITSSSAIAVDSEGRAFITGSTNSDLLPTTTDAFQKMRIRSDCSIAGTDAAIIPCLEAFVAKFNPAGSALVYSTYLGGARDDAAHDIVIDSAGRACISGISTSSNFPLPGALSTAGNTFVAKLNSEGSNLVYSTRAGESAQQTSLGIDSLGNAYLTGVINSVNLAATPGAFRPSSANVLAFKTTDGGSHWEVSHAGLPRGILSMAIDPADSSNLYAFSFGTINRSSDGGKSWSSTASGPLIESSGFDPRNPAIAYAATPTFAFENRRIIKTTDGGITWQTAFDFLNGIIAADNGIIIDPTDSSVFYVLAFPGSFGGGGLFKFSPLNDGLRMEKVGKGMPVGKILAINPSNSKILLAISSDGLYRSANGGKRFRATDLRSPNIQSVVFNSVDPSQVYAAGAGIYRSTDTGETWKKIEDDLPDVILNRLLIDPAGSTFYASTASGAYRSTNGGRHWERIEGGLNDCSRILAIDSHNPNIIYAGGCESISEVFVAKINSAGSAFDYVTYLGEGSASRVAVDAAGNAYVAGSTTSVNFPVKNAFQPDLKRSPDAFLAGLNVSGTRIFFSTYYGGSRTDLLTGIALDTRGNMWLAGLTVSTDLPVVAALQGNLRGQTDAFIAKVMELSAIVPAPRISNVTPSSGPSSRSIEATITGENFKEGAQVRVGGIPATVVSVSPSAIGIIIPVGFAGKVTVAVVNPDGQSDALAGGFTYLLSPQIELAIVIGKDLIVAGREFDKGAVIIIDGAVQATEPDPSSPTSRLIRSKGGKKIKPGQSVSIVVRNANGIVSLPFSFTRPTE